MNRVTKRATRLLATLDKLDITCRLQPWDEGRVAEHVNRIWMRASRVSECFRPRDDGEKVLPRRGSGLLGSLQDEVPHARSGDCRLLLKARDEFSNWVASYFGLDTPDNTAREASGNPVQAAYAAEDVRPSDPKLRPKKPVVVLFGEGNHPLLFGVRVPPLAGVQYCVVAALLKAGEAGFTKDKLRKVSGAADPLGCLDGIREKSQEWARAIIKPGGPGKGGYKIRHE